MLCNKIVHSLEFSTLTETLNHFVNKHLLNAYYMAGIMPGTGFHRLKFLVF